MATLGKAKGSQFEREISKKLSLWMFNDSHTLCRHPTSGANKYVYVGDVIPIKQINWSSFPFLFELKCGYKNQTPTFMNYQIITKWLIKAYSERTTMQHNVWLVTRFKNYKTICIISDQLNINWDLSIYVPELKEYFFVYDLDTLFRYNFEDVIQPNLLNEIKGK